MTTMNVRFVLHCINCPVNLFLPIPVTARQRVETKITRELSTCVHNADQISIMICCCLSYLPKNLCCIFISCICQVYISTSHMIAIPLCATIIINVLWTQTAICLLTKNFILHVLRVIDLTIIV